MPFDMFKWSDDVRHRVVKKRLIAEHFSVENSKQMQIAMKSR